LWNGRHRAHYVSHYIIKLYSLKGSTHNIQYTILKKVKKNKQTVTHAYTHTATQTYKHVACVKA